MDFVTDLIKTRGAQLVARYVGKGLLMLGTYLHVAPSADGYARTGEEVAAFVIAGILFLVDRWSHNKQSDAAK